MAAKYDLSDDGVVVVIGSGAGGGTLSNELAQKGIPDPDDRDAGDPPGRLHRGSDEQEGDLMRAV
jgi:hypothetical protein